MATIPEITDRLEAATEKAENASQIIYDVANGDASTEVPTASGPTPTLKKWFQDLGSSVEPMLAGIPARLDKAILVYPTKAEADESALELPNGQRVIASDAQMEFIVNSNSLSFEQHITHVLEFETIQDLRDAIPPKKKTTAYVMGYWAAGDLGGGYFQWTPASTQSDNGFNVISPSISPSNGRWEFGAIGRHNVMRSGARGSLIADDVVPINTAIQAISNASGGELEFGPYIFGVRGEVIQRSNVRLFGSRGVTTIRFTGNTDSQVLSHPYRGTGAFLENAGVIGIICDANSSIQPKLVATSCATFDPCKNLLLEDSEFLNASGYGVGIESGPGQSDTNISQGITMRRVKARNNGFGILDYDGIDVKSVQGLTMEDCESSGNAGDGIDIRGSGVVLINCNAFNNGASGLECSNNTGQDGHVTVIGGEYRSNLNGIRLASGATTTKTLRVDIVGPLVYANTQDGIIGINSGSRVRANISAHCYNNGQHGIACMVSHENFVIQGSECNGNTGSGIYSGSVGTLKVVGTRSWGNSRYGYEEASSAQRNTVGSGCDFRWNTLGSMLLGSLARISIAKDFIDFDIGSGDNIASASSVTIPFGGETFAITGAGSISTILGGYRHRRITFIMGSGITIQHSRSSGGNIGLNGGTNLVTSATRTLLTLDYDGTVWWESSRSTAS